MEKRGCLDQPTNRFVQTPLYWSEPKVKFGEQITPTACEIFRTPPAQLDISQAELLERIARVLDEREVETRILDRIAA